MSAPSTLEAFGTVFVSYSHDSPDHAHAVLELSNKLRSDGIDCVLDQYEASPPEGWPRWMDREIRKARFVLMICTERYYKRVIGEEKPGEGLGIAWEGNIIYQHLYSAVSNNLKFIPILFRAEHAQYIPTPVQGASRYCMSGADDYEWLYNRMIGRPPAERPPLGRRRSLPERKVRTDIAMLLSLPIDPVVWPIDPVAREKTKTLTLPIDPVVREKAKTLTNFEVAPTPEIDGLIVVKADDGDTRVAAFITREAIDDSFPQYRLTDDERVGLVGSNSNLKVIGDIISAKYARGEACPYNSFGSTILRIDVGYDDLRTGPRLSDDYLLVARGASFQRPF
jgi:hypothetical protein